MECIFYIRQASSACAVWCSCENMYMILKKHDQNACAYCRDMVWHHIHSQSGIKFVVLCRPTLALNSILLVDLRTLALTLTLLRGWWGRCEKNYLPKEEGREGGEKKRVQRASWTRGSNLGPAAYQARVPSCTPGGLFRQASLSVPIDRVGRLRNTTCCMFWR